MARQLEARCQVFHTFSTHLTRDVVVLQRVHARTRHHFYWRRDYQLILSILAAHLPQDLRYIPSHYHHLIGNIAWAAHPIHAALNLATLPRTLNALCSRAKKTTAAPHAGSSSMDQCGSSSFEVERCSSVSTIHRSISRLMSNEHTRQRRSFTFETISSSSLCTAASPSTWSLQYYMASVQTTFRSSSVGPV